MSETDQDQNQEVSSALRQVTMIGGQRDGATTNLYLPLPPTVKTFSFEHDAFSQAYELRIWASGPDDSHAVYVIEGMSDFDAMGRLLEFYRPAPQS